MSTTPIYSATLPLRIVSVANCREHWAVKAKRTKAHRLAALALSVSGFPLPCVVWLTRLAPRKLDDDNLVAAFKALRDGIADRLGVADNDERVTFRYAQVKSGPKQYGVTVLVERRTQ